LGIIHYEAAVGHMAPLSWAWTFKRACKYGSILVCRIGRVSKEDLRRFRPVERLLGATLTFVVLYGSLWVFFGLFGRSLIRMISSSSMSSIWLIPLNTLLGVLPLLLLFRVRHVPKDHMLQDTQRIRSWCIGCGYVLDGLESALGEELWVGPAVCPECGQRYPGIG